MEVVTRMTPEGLEQILLLDGVPVRLEELQDILAALTSPSPTVRSSNPSWSQDPSPQLASSTHRIVPACCAYHGKRKSQQ